MEVGFEILMREGIEMMQRHGVEITMNETVLYLLKKANEGEMMERLGAILTLMNMGIAVELRVRESPDGVVE